jgi:DNA polymerase I-like protein with 3'-5' exonuclease and polymerase domains
VRTLYVPDHPDWCFVQADYKSAELYILAGMSGDELLMADLQGDIHTRNAERYGIPRPIVKNVTYATMYLATPSKASEMILEQAHIYISPAECSRTANAVWGGYAKATAYKQFLVDLCDTQHKVINPFGRVRYFHDGRAPAAVDFIPQSTVADILWCVLKPVAEVARKFGGRMVTTVHDSILVTVPQENAKAVALAMKETMEQRFDCVRPGFYIPVELEMAGPGEPWSAVKKVELA